MEPATFRLAAQFCNQTAAWEIEGDLHTSQQILKTALLWAVSWPLKMGPTGCPETSVSNHHNALRNNPEEHSYHLFRGRKPEISQKAKIFNYCS